MRLSRLVVALAFTAAGMSQAAFAQIGKPMAMGGGGSRSAEGSYRAFALSMPLTINAETVGRLEFNLAGKASLGLEVSYKKEREEAPERMQEEKNESMRAEGKGAAIFVSRYMDGSSMSGLYWGMGAGYREEAVRWRVQPEGSDKQVNLALADKDKMLNHDADLKGMTGHLRVGYRYIPNDWPFVIGGYIGGRHFQPGVKDGDQAKDEEANNVKQAPLTDSEKERLRRKYTTKPEAGVELGFTF